MSPSRTADRPGPEDEPTPGPLGWLELTLQVMRDRSHSSWMLLRDEELLETLRTRGLVAAYLPGDMLAMPDLVLVRLAVSPDGRVAVTADDGAPAPGDPVEEAVPALLDELRTVAAIEDDPVGPPWLPVQEIVDAGRTPARDSRIVYCYKGTDLLPAGGFAKALEAPLTCYREDGWVVAASGHRPERMLTSPPARITGAYPFVVLDRRGERRMVAFAESAKKTALSFSAEWQPPLRPAASNEHPDTLALAAWLADPSGGEAGPSSPEARPDGLSPEQHALLQRWMAEREDASGFLGEVSRTLGVPEIAARLVEAAPGEPDPPGGEQVGPGHTGQLAVRSIMEQDTEPEGRMPWTVLSRFLWRRPLLSITLGAGELLVAVVLAGMLIGGVLDGWWMWVVAVVFLLGGIAHVFEGVFRMRTRRGAPPAD